MMYTTLNKIREHFPCTSGWIKLLKHLSKTNADDEPLSFVTIINSNGFDDALWCCRSAPEYGREWRLFAVWCTLQVKHLITDTRSLHALAVAESYANGLATKEDLAAASDAASDAALAASDAASDAAWAAAWAAGDAASDAAWAAAWAASDAARYAARDAASDAAWAAAWAAWDAARYAAGDATWAAGDATWAAWAAARAARAASDAARAARAARAAQKECFTWIVDGGLAKFEIKG
jgi:hypothetical protein